jgi:hypothetical protein
MLPLLFSSFTRARPNEFHSAGRREAGKQEHKYSFKFELKVAIVRSPGLFFGPPDAAQIPPGKIKFDARNFQKSVEKFKMLQKLSNFFRISRKKTP